MQNLININKRNIDGEAIQTVNARDLHVFLESKQEFANWIKDRIYQYSFIERQDFLINLSKTSNGGRPAKEYHISLNMAKELSMVERNEKGKQARQYFIECEKQILQPKMQVSLPSKKELALMVISSEEEREKLLLENKKLTREMDGLKNLFKEGMTPTQFGKMLNGVNIQKINTFLSYRKWLYNDTQSGHSPRWRVTSYARDKYLTEKQSYITSYGSERFIKHQPILLKKGAQRIYDLYLHDKLPMKCTWNGAYDHDTSLTDAHLTH